MTRLCVAIFVTDLAQAQRDIALAAEAGADMVELRLDSFSGDACHLVDHSILPTIITSRPQWEGGQSEESDERRVENLAFLSHLARYTDLELASFKKLNVNRQEFSLLILSAHDFQGRPDRLMNLVAELNEAPCDIAKIVWTARTIRDNIEAFELLQNRAKPTIALCMGEAGLISRVLAKKFGAFLTFASLRKLEVTAPGQVSIDEMKRLYRWDAIKSTTKVYGVVAHPVAHSMSPAIHNAAFEKTRYDGIYLPLLVNEGYESFKAFMESFLAFAPLDLSGLSITLPHKENALRYLQEKNAEIDPLAVRIGAVNTIVIDRDFRDTGCQPVKSENQHGLEARATQDQSHTHRTHGPPRLRGLNTDYGAILDSITSKLGISREELAGKRVAVLGAGGTGRTAVAALAHYGATVVIYNRTMERAEALAAEFTGKTGKVVAAPMEKLCDSCCQIYLNTTSIGMHPNTDASPMGDNLPKLGPDILVFDTVYNPMRTKLLQQAQAAGAQVIGGVEMFVRQAVAQFEAWTKLPAPVEVMRSVVERRLHELMSREDANRAK